MEVYHLIPNTTYEFRIWGNNYLGAGEIVNTIITTLPEIGDEGTSICFLLSWILTVASCPTDISITELIRILLRDVKEFDKNVWTYAVSVVMGAMVILGLSVCFMLLRDCYEEDERSGKNFAFVVICHKLASIINENVRMKLRPFCHSSSHLFILQLTKPEKLRKIIF